MELLPDDVKEIFVSLRLRLSASFRKRFSSENQSQLDEAILSVTPAVDLSQSLTPTSSQSLFSVINKKNSMNRFKDRQFDTALLSTSQSQTTEQARVFGF